MYFLKFSFTKVLIHLLTAIAGHYRFRMLYRQSYLHALLLPSLLGSAKRFLSRKRLDLSFLLHNLTFYI